MTWTNWLPVAPESLARLEWWLWNGALVAGILAGLLGIAAGIFGYVAREAGRQRAAIERAADKAYIEALQKQARTRQEPQWTPFHRVESKGLPTGLRNITAKLQFSLYSDDNTIPLIVRVAADAEGHYANTVSGPAGIVEQLIIQPATYYVSISHPSIKWKAEVIGYIDHELAGH